MQRISIHLVHRTISKQKRNPPIPTHDPLDHQQPPKLIVPRIQYKWAGRKFVDEPLQLPCAIHPVQTCGFKLFKPCYSLLMPVNQTVITFIENIL